ncbi:hypothetical protein Bca52824_013520 [Brassica carinata]|uniref:Uncharacterized protein n=1 Tax=Brassica carinata TaxID=52824 RepID=A0A8X8B3Y7_BRACI|nr:hypothetical protein Bca52824_013520 [Brassica carinata]
MELLEDGGLPSPWFLPDLLGVLVGKFSLQISAFFSLCSTCGLRWSRVELFISGEFAHMLGVSSGGGAWRRVGSASCSRCLAGPLSSKLEFPMVWHPLSLSFSPYFLSARLSCRRSDEAWVGWRQVSSWALR